MNEGRRVLWAATVVVVLLSGISSFTASAQVGLWRFNEGTGSTTADNSGNGNIGTLTNMGSPWIEGLYGNALSFNGSGYVSIANSASLQVTGDLTISMWINPANIGVRTCNLLHKNYGGEYSLTLEQDGKVCLTQGKSTDGGCYFSRYLIWDGYIANNKWQHIAVTRNMTTRDLKGYLNGVLQYTTTYTDDAAYSPPAATSDPVKIGAGYTNAFSGQMDTVRIYNSVLSASDILVQSLEPREDYVLHWKLDETSGTTAADATPHGNNGTLTNMGGSPWVAGVQNGALNFGSSNDYVTISNNSSLQITGDLTIALWIKPTTVGVRRCSLLHKNYGGEYSVTLEQNGSVCFSYGRSTDSGYYWAGYVVPAGTIGNNQWQHIVLTRTIVTNEVKAYVGGKLAGSAMYPTGANYYPPVATTSPVKVGAGFSNDYNGLIDDVIIAGKVLSAEDVQTLFNSADLRGNWDMNEGTETTAADSSVYGNYASFVNMAASPWVDGHLNPDGYYRKALRFNNSGDYLSVSNSPSLQLANDLTISLWVKPTTIGVKQCSLVDKDFGGEFSLILDQDGAVKLRQGQSRNAGCYFEATVIPSNSVANSDWQHIAVTRNLTTGEIKGYLNGDLKNTVTYDQNANYYPPVTTTSAVTIGSGYFSDYNGDIDKVRLYSRVLDQAEIQAMNLLSAYPDRNYYTTENPVAVCHLNIASGEGLTSSSVMVKDAQGNLLGTNSSPGIDTDATYDISSLSNGSHTVTVELRRTAGEKVFRYKFDIMKRAANAGFETKIDLTNGLVLRDGTPFFPIGLYMSGITSSGTADLQAVANAGFDSIVHWNSNQPTSEASAYLEAAYNYGLNALESQEAYSTINLASYKLTTAQNFWNAYKGLSPFSVDQSARMIQAADYAKQEANLIGYYTFDEPYNTQIAAGQDLYARTNTEDGYHPTLANYSSVITDGANYTNWCDIVSVDTYWAPPRVSGNLRSSVDYVTKYAYLAAQRAKQDRKAFWLALEAERYGGCLKRVLTTDEQRCQAYIALINGAKGILFFCYPICDEDNWNFLSTLTDELSTLKGCMLTPDLKQAVTYSTGTFDPAKEQFVDVQVSLRKAPAGAGYDYVLLAANSKNYPVDVTYNVSLLGASDTVSRLFSQDTYAVTDGSFSEQLPALAARAYTFSSASTAAIAINVALTPGSATAETVYPASGRPGKTNLMQNPSFEDATLTNWPDYWWTFNAYPRINAANQQWGQVTDSPYHGDKCLKMTTSNANYRAYFCLSPQFTTPSTKSYTFSAYMKADQAGRTAVLGSSVLSGYCSATLTTSWARYQYTSTVPANFNTSNTFYIQIPNGTVWVDAVQVEEGTSATAFTMDYGSTA